MWRVQAIQRVLYVLAARLGPKATVFWQALSRRLGVAVGYSVGMIVPTTIDAAKALLAKLPKKDGLKFFLKSVWFALKAVGMYELANLVFSSLMDFGQDQPIPEGERKNLSPPPPPEVIDAEYSTEVGSSSEKWQPRGPAEAKQWPQDRGQLALPPPSGTCSIGLDQPKDLYRRLHEQKPLIKRAAAACGGFHNFVLLRRALVELDQDVLLVYAEEEA